MPHRPSRRHVVFTLIVFVTLASLDNTAIALIPAMIPTTAESLGTSKGALGVMTGLSILVTALAAVPWGFWGDRTNRKHLLFVGTVIWAAGTALSATASSFGPLFGYQMLTAVGLGSVASVGFSVVSDFVSPRRRGLAMSFWGLSQGIGTLVGTVLASQLGADGFRTPLLVVAAAGAAFAVLYLAAFEAPRGMAEPELAELFRAGDDYEYRIERRQLPVLMRRRTNLWLIAQGLTAQLAYGSLIWVPLLFQEKVLAEGYSTATATRVGGLFAAVFSFGALFSILAGHLGDRLQRRTARGRALLSAAGVLGAVPFFLLFFFAPLRGLDVTDGAGTVTLTGEVLANLVAHPWVAVVFAASVTALALTSADSPNWFALITDVNLPEHRGTVFGLGNLSNGIGRSAGNGLTALLSARLETALPPPLNWAVGLATFQVFFLPTGYCYWRASLTSPGDLDEVRTILERRGRSDEP